jgi:tetratricopeptide (TPR) repeat protein
MSETTSAPPEAVEQLAASGYWPARAALAVKQGRFSLAVEICQPNLELPDCPVSAKLIYALALQNCGQTDSAREQLYRVLSNDPENLVALKNLGDISFAAGDEVAAMACYQRVLDLDPECRGLASTGRRPEPASLRTITLRHKPQGGRAPERDNSLKEIPFFTETMGDLYLTQGYPRLAIRVFETLCRSHESPRLSDKLTKARQCLQEKEK